MNGAPGLYKILSEQNITFEYHEHPPVPTIETNKLVIRDPEHRFRQGKLSRGSDKRLMKHLGLTPGSVSPFGLINENKKHI